MELEVPDRSSKGKAPLTRALVRGAFPWEPYQALSVPSVRSFLRTFVCGAPRAAVAEQRSACVFGVSSVSMTGHQRERPIMEMQQSSLLANEVPDASRRALPLL